ncbi:hypothetical protein ACA910_019962 [Epithemia clementina (nom. ined.)]
MCCCCCPPAISALFCLWCRSGCRKSTVASTLTFFPPEPALYKFERITKDGRVLDEEEDAQQPKQEDKGYRKLRKEGAVPVETASSDRATEGEGSIEIEDSPIMLAEAETRGQTQQQMKSPMEELSEQALERRKRAKLRKIRDDKDVEAGVTYRLALDQRLILPPYEESCIRAVKVPGPNGALIATLIYQVPADQCTPETKTIIYSHGNATDIGAMFPIQVIMAHSLSAHVVVYDYSGYGESGGVPDERNTYHDIEAVYKFVLRDTANSVAKNVVLYGQSVGSGPCCYLAAKDDQIGGMILHSPFTSGMRVLTPNRALACLDIYPNIDRIKHVNCPVMVIHGCLDQEVDISHGKEMHEAVPREFQRDPWWVPDRGHNDITEGRGKLAEYIQRIRNFVRGLDSS